MIIGTTTKNYGGYRVHTLHICPLRTNIVLCIGTPDDKFKKDSNLNEEDITGTDGLERVHGGTGYIRLREPDTGTLMHELYHLFQDITVFGVDEREFAAYVFEDVVNRILLLDSFKIKNSVKEFYIKDKK